jgi:hypothetical protein
MESAQQGRDRANLPAQLSPLPCPFCGRLPGWRNQSADKSVNFRHLACINPDCNLEVRTRRSGADEELIGDWNRRVHAEEALISNQIREHLRTMLRRAKGDNRKS